MTQSNSIKHETSLIDGSPISVILRFSAPIVAAMLLQQVYGFVDNAIIGHYLGTNALAGVGATVSLNYLVFGFCSGCCNGFCIPFARSVGAKDTDKMRAYFINSIYLTGVLAVIMVLISCFFCKSFLLALHTPAELMDYSYKYIIIIFMGLPVTLFFNLFSSILRSLGNSKTPLVILLISSCMNIVLDLWFIARLHMGISGAAIATVLSQMLSLILVFRSLIRCNKWIRVCPLIPQPTLIWELITMGIPMGGQASIMSIGTLIIQNSVNCLGITAVAANTVGIKIGFLFAIAFEGLGTAMATYAGQNLGAKRKDRIYQGFYAAIKIGLVYCFITFLFLFFTRYSLITFFVDAGDEKVAALAGKFIITLAAFFFAALFLNVFRYMIQGFGHPEYALLAGIFEVIARIIVAYILVPRWGFTAICFANPLAWILSSLVLLPVFIKILSQI